jgi:hypothetical protein
VAQTVLDELDQCLLPDQVAAVARCIDRLGGEPGIPLGIDSPSPPGSHYLAAIPDHDQAPVVIYRPASTGEQGDFVVTALIDRVTYSEHQSAERQGIKDRPLDRALSTPATGPAFGHGPICPPVGL